MKPKFRQVIHKDGYYWKAEFISERMKTVVRIQDQKISCL